MVASTVVRSSEAKSQERDAKQQELAASIDNALAGITNDEQFIALLNHQSKFHRYSFTNAMLIQFQRPGATQVAGFNAWKKLKRTVSKGEKGIAIFAPMSHKRTDEATGESRYWISGFRIVYVFDVSQTEGEPLPNATCPILTGDEGHDLYRTLTAVAAGEGVSISEGTTQQFEQPNLMGWYQPSEKHIVVRTHDTERLQQVKTLAHELGHHYHISKHGTESQNRDERETIAESVAYVVLKHYGLDSTARSFPYIAGWTKDIKAFKSALSIIHKVAMEIIDACDSVAGIEDNLEVAA